MRVPVLPLSARLLLGLLFLATGCPPADDDDDDTASPDLLYVKVTNTSPAGSCTETYTLEARLD